MGTNLLLVSFVVLVLFTSDAFAFGAGDIPDFAYLNDKAFRHGDIENILENLAKVAGHSSGGLLDFASKVLNVGGNKFTKGDVKKVYFGNWLRDYSQAMDIAGLSKLTADTLVLIVSVLGFMTFGFATKEFEVTAERLGVYLPVVSRLIEFIHIVAEVSLQEHIDNPKGYGAKEGDPRRFHQWLRPPVNPRELEIDQRNGMKNYIASEDGGWDTSTALIRRKFRDCIEYGRRSGGREGGDLWEAYRLLGTGLHTIEDLLAHSNWCELMLRKLGHRDVFCHVGDGVTVNTPNGSAPPLITGTFGGADFLHSLMGEATDKISQSSVTDLSAKMEQAGSNQDDNFGTIKKVLGMLGGGGNNPDQGENMKQDAKAYQFNPDEIAPPDVQQKLRQVLDWHDEIFRSIEEGIEKIPGLSDMLDNFSNALNAYVYGIITPYVAPMLKSAVGVLGEGSKAVIDSDDQYEVFNNPNASDPSHSVLSKDHFALILNEPAGKIAKICVEYTVGLIVTAWYDHNSNPDQVISQILEVFHHPYYATGQSQIQGQMQQAMERWLQELEDQQETLSQLTKDSVRQGGNKRKGEEFESAGSGCGHGAVPSIGGYQQQQQQQSGGYNRQQSSYNSGGYERQQQQQTSYNRGGGYERQERNDYNSNSGGYGRQQQEQTNYGGGYARPESEVEAPWNQRRSEARDNVSSYQQRQQDDSYGSSGGGGYNPSYGEEQSSGRNESYNEREGASYGSNYGGGDSRRERDNSDSGYGRRGNDDYGERRQQRNEYEDQSRNEYGQSRSRGDDDNQGYGRQGRNEYEETQRDENRGYGRNENSNFQGYRENNERGEEDENEAQRQDDEEAQETYEEQEEQEEQSYESREEEAEQPPEEENWEDSSRINF